MYLGGVCFITDRSISSLTVEDSVRKILDAGIFFVQYREKGLSRREIFYQAEKLRAITEEYNAVLIINDHADIAIAVGADGVHLGQDDLPLEEAKRILGKKIIGISTHSIEEAMKAERGGADYIGFGPVYYTATKDAGAPKGVGAVSEVRKRVSIPIVAIGGIKYDNLDELIKCGIDAVAVASAILKSPDVYLSARNFARRCKGEKIRTQHPSGH